MKKEKYSDLTLLSKNKTTYSKTIDEARLEVFDNTYSNRDYEITFKCPEFTSLCPVTGQPDFGNITIRYIPNKLCIESKSLKLHLFSYRNHNSFHEEVVNSILDSIVKACSPRWIEVLGHFNPRGGIAINVKAISGKRETE